MLAVRWQRLVESGTRAFSVVLLSMYHRKLVTSHGATHYGLKKGCRLGRLFRRRL